MRGQQEGRSEIASSRKNRRCTVEFDFKGNVKTGLTLNNL